MPRRDQPWKHPATCGFFDQRPHEEGRGGPELLEAVRSDRVRSSLTRPGGGLLLFALRLAGQDMRGMMEDHAPPRPRSLEDIGHEDGSDGDVALELREDVLRARHPGESTVHPYLNVQRVNRSSRLSLKMASQDCRTFSQPVRRPQPGWM